MFKLVKMLNGKYCAPEIVEVKMVRTFPYFAGAMYFYESGSLVRDMPGGDHIKKFIPIESLPMNSGKGTIKGFFVSEDMIFEADVEEDEEIIDTTFTYDCYYGDEDHCIGVSTSMGSFATILDASEQRTRGKVLVYFKK